jgi:ketosteroid isomerase-like protein
MSQEVLHGKDVPQVITNYFTAWLEGRLDDSYKFMSEDVLYESYCGVLFKECDFTGEDRGREAVKKMFTETIPKYYDLSKITIDEIHTGENGHFVTVFLSMIASIKSRQNKQVEGKFVHTFNINDQGLIIRVRDFLIEHEPEFKRSTA